MQKLEKRFYRAEEMIDTEFPFKAFRSVGIKAEAYHCHDYIQMWYVKHGSCIHYINDRDHEFEQGSIFILPPNVYHGVRSFSEDAELIGLEFTEEFINEDIHQNSSHHLFDYSYIQPFMVSLERVKPTFPLAGPVKKTIEMLLEETLLEYTEKSEHYELFIKANLLKILAVITREYHKGIDEKSKSIAAKYRSSIMQALDYIKENYHTKIYLDDICRLTMMSPAYFSYLFKHETGRTLTEYVNFIRIERAKEYLKGSDRSISFIANETGFGNTALFDRAFKKEVGMTPLQYRKDHQLK